MFSEKSFEKYYIDLYNFSCVELIKIKKNYMGN